MLMDVKEIRDLIKEVLQSDICEFELEHTDTRVRFKREFGRDSATLSSSPRQLPLVNSLPSKSISSSSGATATEAPEDSTLHVITSPIVGTAYRAPSPESNPYVKLGDQIEEGSILCLIEAMKLMNEIPSDIAGEVVHIYIENGYPVEFGQKLFAVRPRKQG
jgi:acetyl-CoA carboxylase biotin carboxyl carrier protein